MKGSKKIPSLIFSLFGCCLGFSQSNIDILHYKFSLSLSDKNDTVYGSTTIKLRFLYADSSFSIDLASPNSQGKGMKTDKIISNGIIVIKNFIAENDKVKIILSKSSKANDTASITIYYHGIPADGLIISKNSHGDRTFFADNWPTRAHNWIPCIDDPADKASFEFIVTAPPHYSVISNGIQIEEAKLPDNKKLTHWKEDISLPTKIMVIGAADFAIKKYSDSPAGIPVTAWVFAKDSADGFRDYDMAPSILKYFIYYIGPYPYAKLANVQSKTIFGGMENASAIFYSENSVSGKHDDESLLAHEIAHQWFGDMVTEKSFAHFWLSEGFATYFAHLYSEARYGTDRMNIEMQKDREAIVRYSRWSGKPVVDTTSAYNHLLNVNSYEKGSWVLHMLNRQLGDSVFLQIIRTYYDTYKGRNADTKDFEKIAEKVSGEKLDSFFRQWLYIPEVPKLNINWKYSGTEKTITITVEQIQNTDAFIFPLEISIGLEAGKSQTKKLTINKKMESFILPLNSPPFEIVVDPHTSLLYSGSVQELK